METSRSIVIAGLDPAIYPFSKKMDARGVGERKRRLSSNGYPAHDGSESSFVTSKPAHFFFPRTVVLVRKRYAPPGKSCLLGQECSGFEAKSLY
jgi:hypothetical protein